MIVNEVFDKLFSEQSGCNIKEKTCQGNVDSKKHVSTQE